ncbi:kinase-associated lipoprotein B [Bacillus gobiensis]|uniref:kinase-associated lipoprotein B n=1 Tax=Bacillus gobiensis TaxID=1441095 RepID=UPI003D20B54E
MNEFQIGDDVKVFYKTGAYTGVITDIKPAHYLVRVQSVDKHPDQGDLHNPKRVDVPLFHERRALAFREQVNIPFQMVKKFDGSHPDYEESLRTAVEKLKTRLKEDDSLWAKKSLENLSTLAEEYFQTK